MYIDSCNDLPPTLFRQEDAAYRLLSIESPNDDVIWEIARSSGEAPHFGNLRAAVFFEELKNKLLELDPALDIQYEVNALSTYFNVNEEQITDEEELREIIEKAKKDGISY